MIRVVIKFGKPVALDIDARLGDLTRRFAADARIAASWIFGSRARGEADTLSDVDLAVLAAGSPSREQLASWQLDWIEMADEALGTDEISLVVINNASLVLRYQIFRDARLLHAASPEAAADAELATIRAYLDFHPRLEEYDRELLASASAGRLR